MPAFLLEDGTGIENATAYVSVDYADDYLGEAWAAETTQDKEAAIMAGSEYADARWGPKLLSSPLVSTQGLEMPRADLYSRYGVLIEGVPDDWAKAVCIYASASLAGTLYPAQSTSVNTTDVKRKKTVVGPVETEIEYQTGAITTTTDWVTFSLADTLCKQFTTTGSSSIGVIRN
jgi:hypothetical protein